MARTPKRAAAPQQRMKPEQREKLILAEAKVFFSERGLSGGTEELARRLGVTQPLLFRYFPTKVAMIERIFRDIEASAFDPGWVALLGDASVPLEERLVAFYSSYFHQVMTKENFRLMVYGGLAWSERPVPHYYGRMRRVIYPAIARAIRASLRPALQAEGRITEQETETVLTLHAMIYHLGIRKWVFGIPLKGRIEDVIRMKVRIFLGGVEAMAAASKPAPRRQRAKAPPLPSPA